MDVEWMSLLQNRLPFGRRLPNGMRFPIEVFCSTDDSILTIKVQYFQIVKYGFKEAHFDVDQRDRCVEIVY